MTEPSLATAVSSTLDTCLVLGSDETLLIVTDAGKRAIAQAFADGGRARGAETVFAEMTERLTHGTEPPAPIAAAMKGSDVVIAPTTKSLSHTEARRAASAEGVRIATLPDVTEDMLARMMNVDLEALMRRSAAVAEILTSGREVRVTSGAGTDVTFGIEGRQGIADDGRLSQPGAFGNLPAGEGFVAPVEGTTQGRIVFDGSIWPIGLLQDPLVVDIVDGYATRMEGSSAERFRSLLEPHGRDAFSVAELGVGTNDAARLSGNVLEDEKLLGTIHVALGDNHTIGGIVRVPSHQDGMVLDPTMLVDGEPLLEGGRLLI